MVFKPLSQIAAGQSLSYTLKVKGTEAGTLRLRAKLTSGASTEPLITEEATKFYAD